MQQTVSFTDEQLTGRSATHVVPLPGSDVLLHAAVVPSFLALQAAAASDGIDLRPLSAFRDFARQRDIWNAKCRGARPLLDRDGRRIDAAGLDESALADAVLLWSALPGASRHHWGTDLDVIDAAAVPAGYRVQLLPAEFASGGPFARLDAWLADHAGEYGFYRPYAEDRGGVQPEPWHISHGPVSIQALSALSVEVLADALRGADLAAVDAVLARLPELHARYVRNVESFEGTTSPSRPA